MSIKLYKPTTNARRNMSVTDYSELSKVAPEKSLLEPLKKSQVVTAMVESQFVTAVALTVESTVLSTSSVQSLM